MISKFVNSCLHPGPENIKKFMLNLAEHEMFLANIC